MSALPPSRLGHGSEAASTLNTYAARVEEADRRAATTTAAVMPAPVVAPRQPRGLYQAIAAELRKQITSAQLQPGDQLPTVADLAALHKVAVGTAHRAIALLRTEGLIEVSRGRRATVVPCAQTADAVRERTSKHSSGERHGGAGIGFCAESRGRVARVRATSGRRR